ncbi:MAG: hypothetical protein O7C75_15565, partial [Verrucomicrobia bacterium]|nr:hypothetical protein [Verrucomicrobiota bacterium]
VMGPSSSSFSQSLLREGKCKYDPTYDAQSCIIGHLEEVSNGRPLFWLTPRTGGTPQIVADRFKRV